MAVPNEKKFSLLELLMIIMLVGIVTTFVISGKVTKAYRLKIQEYAVPAMQVIAAEDVIFKAAETKGDGDYAMDISQLNLKWAELSTKYAKRLNNVPLHNKYFTYSVTDSTIVATTNAEFGKEGLSFVYALPTGPFSVPGDASSDKIINPNWLP